VSESWGGVKVVNRGPSQSKSESLQAEVKPVREIVLSPTRVERELAEENIQTLRDAAMLHGKVRQRRVWDFCFVDN
jgi:hypothetical protein